MYEMNDAAERGSFARFREPGGPRSDSFVIGAETLNGARDRFPAGFRDVIDDSLECWRTDPLARRIVSITTDFAVGRGFSVSAAGDYENSIINGFWNHPLNRMDERMRDWSDELCRAGNLFVMLSSDPSGKTFVRAIPAVQVEEIIPRENDVEQPVSFRLREYEPGLSRIPETRTVPAADLLCPALEERMLHFTVNRPIGGQWGEPDLAPLLVWLHRYSMWLEDRARQNHYRNCFVYVVKTGALSESARLARQNALNLHPPHPGSILVTGRDEEWTVLSPSLESADANEDGLALKKMIAAGAGLPLQYLAEPGSASKAETEGVEGSVLRGFEQRQQVMIWIAAAILRHVLARRALTDPRTDSGVELSVKGDNIDRTVRWDFADPYAMNG